MSVALPMIRGSPSKSVSPIEVNDRPASIVGEPAAWWKSPVEAFTKSGAAFWLVVSPLMWVFAGEPAPVVKVFAKFEYTTWIVTSAVLSDSAVRSCPPAPPLAMTLTSSSCPASSVAANAWIASPFVPLAIAVTLRSELTPSVWSAKAPELVDQHTLSTRAALPPPVIGSSTPCRRHAEPPLLFVAMMFAAPPCFPKRKAVLLLVLSTRRLIAVAESLCLRSSPPAEKTIRGRPFVPWMWMDALRGVMAAAWL